LSVYSSECPLIYRLAQKNSAVATVSQKDATILLILFCQI